MQRRYLLLLILLLLGYFLWLSRLLLNEPGAFHYGLYQVNFAVHEIGHMLFMPFGNNFLTAAGGTMFQLFVPFFAVLSFLRQNDDFGAAMAVGWLGVNFFNISAYISDAIDQDLYLVPLFGSEPVHDWNYLLIELGVLSYCEQIGFAVYILAVCCMIFCIAYGIYYIYREFIY